MNMNNNVSFKVRTIISEECEGLSRVTLDTTTFDAVRQSLFARLNKETPLLNFTKDTDSEGNYVSIFNFRGVTVYNLQDKIEKKSVFLMNSEEAKKFLVPMSAEKGLPFKLSNFLVSAKAVTSNRRKTNQNTLSVA